MVEREREREKKKIEKCAVSFKSHYASRKVCVLENYATYLRKFNLVLFALNVAQFVFCCSRSHLLYILFSAKPSRKLSVCILCK